MESASFKKGMTDAERAMKVTQQKFDKIGTQMAGVGKALTVGITAPIIGIGAAIGKSANDLAASTREMRNSAQLAGEGFEQFQRQAYAASKVGIEYDKLSDIFKDVRERVGEFVVTGGGPLQDAFDALNGKVRLTVDELRGLSGKDALQLIMNRMQEAKLSTEEMSFVLESLGSDATALIPLLKDGGAAFDELGGKAAVVSAEDAKGLEAYTQAQEKLGQATKQLTIAFVNSGLLDAITDVVQQVANFAAKLSEVSPTAIKTGVAIAGIAAALGPVLGVIGNLTSAFGILLPLLVKLSPAFTALRIAALALMSNPVILGFAAVVAGIYYAWQNWDKIKPYIDRVGAAVSAFWTRNIKPAFDAIRSAVAGIGNLIGKMVQIGRDMIAGLVNGIKANAAAVWNALKNIVLSGIENVKAFLGIKSPSRVFMAIGRDIGAGLAIGIDTTREAVASSMVGLGEGLQEFREQSEITTVRVAKSFKDMATETLDSLRGLADSIKSGGFLDIFESVVGLFLQVGSTGLFGQKLAANINKTVDGARAMGGPVRAGGSYLVGERGPEIFSPSRSGQIIPNGELRGMAGSKLQVEVVAHNDGFGAIIRDHAGVVVAQAAPSIAGMGSAGAQMTFARSRKRAMA